MAAFGALWLPISMVRAGRDNASDSWLAALLSQGGATSGEAPEDPSDGELNAGRFSTFDGSRLAGPDDPVNVIIELVEPPAVEAFSKEQADVPGLIAQAVPQAVAAAQAQMARIEQSQQELVDELSGARIDARVLSRVQRVFNGVSVEVAAGKVDEIRALRGVRAVHQAGLYYPMLDVSVPLIGGPKMWASSGTGQGIVIANVDNGIDYTHKNFGGVRFYSSDNRRIVEPGSFPTPKVIAGFDFAGDEFDAASTDPAKRIPQPDPDPLPCGDHGTKVASVIAGLGVTVSGTTYAGPYDQSTPLSSLKISPGVAPGASLIALKVFGCGGATRGDLIVQALDRAIDPNGDGDFSDRAHIVNMSLGSPFLPLAGSPEHAALDRLVQAGSIPVIAAGNSGDTYYSINGLGQTSNSISVGGMLSGIAIQNIEVNSPPSIAGVYPAKVSAIGPKIGPSGFTGSVIIPSPADACVAIAKASGLAPNDDHREGPIILIDEGNCSRVTKVRNAQNAGAGAVIFASSSTTQPLIINDDGTGGDIEIPSYMLPSTVTDSIRRELIAGTKVIITGRFGSSVGSNPGLANTLLPGSSRGGSFGNLVKPDISAPGALINSAFYGSGDWAGFAAGTSMSTAHVSGSIALMLGKNPNLRYQGVKELIYGTTTDVLFGPGSGSPKQGAAQVGAGTVSVSDAAAADGSVRFKQGGSGTLTGINLYGDVQAVIGNKTINVVANITNNSNSTKAYTVAYDRSSDVPGVDPSFPSTVTVGPNTNTDFPINWALNALIMKHTRDSTISATQANNPRHWLSEEMGNVIFTPVGGGQALRLPVYYAARPASNMSTAQSSLNLTGQTGTVALSLTGQHVQTGANFPADEVSLVSPLELQGTDPNDDLTPPLLDYLDLRYTGVRSDYESAGGIADTRILFGVSTYGDWSSPNQVTFNVFIDTNRDGTDDFHLFNTSFPNAQGGPSDVFVTRLRNIQTGSIATQFFVNSFSAAQFNTVPFNTDVMVLPLAASALGLTDTSGVFSYEVKTSVGNVVVDSSGPFVYDATRPRLRFGSNTMFFDLNGGTIPCTYNLTPPQAESENGLATRLQQTGPLGVLLLHHHNTSGNRAQVLLADGGAQGPRITALRKTGKHIDVDGQLFVEGARVLINEEVRKTVFFSATELRAKKAGKTIQDGDVVVVRNPDGARSAPVVYRNGG
jgi:hypothetical protein